MSCGLFVVYCLFGDDVVGDLVGGCGLCVIGFGLFVLVVVGYFG